MSNLHAGPVLDFLDHCCQYFALNNNSDVRSGWEAPRDDIACLHIVATWSHETPSQVPIAVVLGRGPGNQGAAAGDVAMYALYTLVW